MSIDGYVCSVVGIDGGVYVMLTFIVAYQTLITLIDQTAWEMHDTCRTLYLFVYGWRLYWSRD